MTALLDATDSQMANLAGLVESLCVAEATLSSMQAARDGLLAIAARLAIDIAKQGDHPDRGDHSIRTVAAEIAAVQRASDRTVERRMAAASELVDLFPTVWAAQGAGRISAAHSRVIVDAGSHLGDADRASYAAILLPLADVESPNRLRPLARRIAERFMPTSITSRHRKARSERRVWVTAGEDGMAALHTHAPAALVHGMFDRLSQMAHLIRTHNRSAARDARRDGREFDADERSVDEIRADLLADLVLTGTPVGHDSADTLLAEIRAHITVTIPVTTLMTGGDAECDNNDGHGGGGHGVGGHGVGGHGVGCHGVGDHGGTGQGDTRPSQCGQRRTRTPAPPAELDGVVPIDTDTARHLAGNATGWDRVFTHPFSGGALIVDRYRPSKHLRRHLRARDARCRFPGCGVPASKSDLDHTHAASTGGDTSDANLATLCRRHHVLKHHTPWHVAQGEHGVLVWTSPTGRTYTDTPPAQNTVTFDDSVGDGLGDTDTDTAAAPF
nr:HNH endonuclease signature motif containing protein [Microbacterium hydrocarbonoxydans]